ncbi:MAG TPA: hypothetical protein VN641_12885 [Urbifossiella sp.]|nr:hypothetical protein [Urbifossiella sp.]
MDYSLLRTWLGLPTGAWPPDHYALLGFAAGQVEPAAIEPRVLRQMDRLRQNQLLHPELVTEGMNRLAQALITLTDPIGKAAYDEELGFAAEPIAHLLKPQFAKPIEPPLAVPVKRPAPLVIAPPVIDDEPFFDDAAFEIPDATDVTQEIAVPESEAVKGYEMAEAEPLPPRFRAAVVEAPKLPLVRAELVEAEEIPEASPPSATRRWIYTRLALLRRSLRAWDRLGAILGDPQEPIDRPGRLLLLLEAVAAVRPHLPALSGVVGGIDQPGGIVVTLLNQPLLLDTLRRLLPDQRQTLAIDWRRGHTELQDEYLRLRKLARESRAPGEGRPRLPAPVRWVRDFPELLLVAAALFVLAIASARSVIGR